MLGLGPLPYSESVCLQLVSVAVSAKALNSPPPHGRPSPHTCGDCLGGLGVLTHLPLSWTCSNIALRAKMLWGAGQTGRKEEERQRSQRGTGGSDEKRGGTEGSGEEGGGGGGEGGKTGGERRGEESLRGEERRGGTEEKRGGAEGRRDRVSVSGAQQEGINSIDLRQSPEVLADVLVEVVVVAQAVDHVLQEHEILPFGYSYQEDV